MNLHFGKYIGGSELQYSVLILNALRLIVNDSMMVVAYGELDCFKQDLATRRRLAANDLR